MTEEENGVAHVRFMEGKFKPREFYAVFFRGAMQPTQFYSWTEAREHLVALLNKEIEEQPT